MNRPNPRFSPDALRRAESMFRGQLPRHLVDRDELAVDANGTPLSIRERDANLAIDWKFQERNSATQARNQHLTPSALFANPLVIIHPSLPHYGPNHGTRTAQLAVYIAQIEGVTDRSDLEVLKNAALMHDIGRRFEAGKDDPEHAAWGAEMADRFIRSDSTGVNQRELRERVCKLIAQHTLAWKSPPQDPLLRALSDADALEGCRFGQGELGQRLVRERYARLLSPWCQRQATQVKWKRKYGWD